MVRMIHISHLSGFLGGVAYQFQGGHLRPDLYGLIPTYIERHGIEAGAEVARFELAHMNAIKDVVAKENIDCDLNITRNMNVYLDEEGAVEAKKTFDALVAKGLSFVDDIHYTSEKNAEGVHSSFTFLSGLRVANILRMLESGLWS